MDRTDPTLEPNNETRCDPNHDPHRDAADAADELIVFASQAEDAIRQLARLTLRAPKLAPADIDRILGHLAEAIAALPQVTTQLSQIVGRTSETHNLAMDGMTTGTDPDLAIDTARLHLLEARHERFSTYRRLNAAGTEVAHVSATPIDDLDEVQPRSLS